MSNKNDRRNQNNAHATVRNIGAAAARRREPIHSCPYSHPAMRSSWLRGFAAGKQLTLGFDLENADA